MTLYVEDSDNNTPITVVFDGAFFNLPSSGTFMFYFHLTSELLQKSNEITLDWLDPCDDAVWLTDPVIEIIDDKITITSMP